MCCSYGDGPAGDGAQISHLTPKFVSASARGCAKRKGDGVPLRKHKGTPARALAKCVEQFRPFTCRAVARGPGLIRARTGAGSTYTTIASASTELWGSGAIPSGGALSPAWCSRVAHTVIDAVFLATVSCAR